MPRLRLGLVLHNHQPVGNYGFVIEDVYEHAYRPMLEALERHPRVRIALHTSGCLFDWIGQHRTEYVSRLRVLCDRGQVEMLTGGYYEPVLPMISDDDKLGQIRKLTDFIEDRFGQVARGLWLTERVWEPALPAPLCDAGVRWTLLDDEHFHLAGMREGLDGYYITEDQGRRVALFAGSQWLRYAIPWRNVDDLMGDLWRYAEGAVSETPYLVLGDDGEKFGAWPTTYAHVWEQGWIDQFFAALERSSDWLELMTPSDYMARVPARGLVYLPSASYAEMMEWALPAAVSSRYRDARRQLEGEHPDALNFMRGGFWRQFLAKYPEANAMHKRGLRINAKLRQRDDPAAREALWASQCNCPYWHGVFGGVYLRHIRRATNSSLVQAERLADGDAAPAGVRVTAEDIDFDGRGDVLLQTRDLSLLVHPDAGGMISEFDLRRRDTALLDVMTRRPEPYHDVLTGAGQHGPTGDATRPADVRVKEEGLGGLLVFDRFRRAGLQDWILPCDAGIEQFMRGEAVAEVEPTGSSISRLERVADACVLELARESHGWLIGKRITVPAAGESIDIAYTITNTSPGQRSARFLSEWNISPPHALDGDDRIAMIEADGLPPVDATAASGVVPGLRRFQIRGSASFGIECAAAELIDLWHFPVETISSSEGGVERLFQGISLSLSIVLDLEPGASRELSCTWSVKEL
jgi:alpha-amylase